VPRPVIQKFLGIWHGRGVGLHPAELPAGVLGISHWLTGDPVSKSESSPNRWFLGKIQRDDFAVCDFGPAEFGPRGDSTALLRVADVLQVSDPARCGGVADKNLAFRSRPRLPKYLTQQQIIDLFARRQLMPPRRKGRPANFAQCCLRDVAVLETIIVRIARGGCAGCGGHGLQSNWCGCGKGKKSGSCRSAAGVAGD